LPAFAYYGQGWQFGVLGKLPVPKMPFGLRLEGPKPITAAVLTELTHLKDNLQALDVSSDEIGPFGPRWSISNRELKEVGSLKNLKALSLAGMNITDAGLEQLMALEKLEMLNLARTRVTSKDLAFISCLKNLRILSLSETQVSNDGMINLRELKRLQWLNLSKTRVSDRGLEHLKALKNLRNLMLEGTWVSEQAILEFRKAVPKCVVSYNPSVHPPFPRPDD
jgi:internalin A